MIKDQFLKTLCIPLCGIIIPYLSGIVSYGLYTPMQLAVVTLYFITCAFYIWRGCRWMHLKLRNSFPEQQNPMVKLLSISTISCLYGSAVGSLFCFAWFRFSKEIFNWNLIYRFDFFIIVATLVITLIYEILYLTKERDLDNKIVDQLGNELTHAEVTALRYELDPHFIFNALNTLSYLIGTDKVRADLFNRNLAEVYKYFLLNKENELVSASKEIEFIRRYFFLLSIRHDEKLQISIGVAEEDSRDILIIPSALQILVENAIKHNSFTETNPLFIRITIEDGHWVVENSKMRKDSMDKSTLVGLRNLRSQYFLLSQKNIIIEQDEHNFRVKLPIIWEHKKQAV